MTSNNYNLGWIRVLFFLLCNFVITSITTSIGMLIAGVEIDENFNPSSLDEIQQIIVVFCNFLGSFFVLLFFIKIIEGKAFVDIGLRLKNRTLDIVIGLIIGLLVMSMGLILLLTFNLIVVEQISIDLENLVYTFLLFIIISFNEELVIRGYILRNFMSSFSRIYALLGSAFIFALFHILNPNITVLGFIDLFLAGILLGITYIFTKNLWFAIALHFSWNFCQSILGFNVSGFDNYSILEIKFLDDNIFTGGTFGFEGSILSVLFQVPIIVAIFWYYTKYKTKKTSK